MSEKIITLKKNYEFKNVLSNGKYYIEKQIIVYIKKNKYNTNRIGIAINTKLCHAVRRNRIKRLIRENYRELMPFIEKGYDIIFLWNKKESTENADFYIIKENIYGCLKMANVIKVDDNL